MGQEISGLVISDRSSRLVSVLWKDWLRQASARWYWARRRWDPSRATGSAPAATPRWSAEFAAKCSPISSVALPINTMSIAMRMSMMKDLNEYFQRVGRMESLSLFAFWSNGRRAGLGYRRHWPESMCPYLCHSKIIWNYLLIYRRNPWKFKRKKFFFIIKPYLYLVVENTIVFHSSAIDFMPLSRLNSLLAAPLMTSNLNQSLWSWSFQMSTRSVMTKDDRPALKHWLNDQLSISDCWF